MIYIKDITISLSAISGTDISLFLDLGEYYSFSSDNVKYAFQVSSKVDRDNVGITWEGTVPSSFPIQVSSFTRGLGSSTSIYGLNFLRRGFLDIDNIIFDLFFKKICKWSWTGVDNNTQWEDKETSNVDFFFFNKRPITRQPFAERTLGAQNNVDSQYQTSTKKSNEGIESVPYISFQPLGEVLSDDVMLRVEEFYATLDNLSTDILDTEYKDIETFQPPQLYEFNYQLTCVTDSWKDCRILNSHVQNSIIPRIGGERFVTFPSGFTHSVRIEASEIVAIEDQGTFETTITFTFILPLIEQAPELTWSWLSAEADIDDDTNIPLV